MTKPRVRFAPSPTGFMHLGNARTALFNWLFARHHGGKFLLRIEDTDRERHTEEAVRVIYDSLKWLGLNWDEEVLFQSRRLPLYHKIADELIENGLAYRCTCTREELEQKKKIMEETTGQSKYDKSCRNKNLPKDCGTHVVRFKMPTEGVSQFNDMIQGSISKNYNELDDFIMLRSDGMPTYQFAVVVDDIEMNITHVIRGSDHIDNTHDQIALYNALNKQHPLFGHAPRILGLSKRKGSPSVEFYREHLGLTAEGLNNYIVRLGWSHNDMELFTTEQLIELFDIDAVNKANANFDEDKLMWVNQQQLRMISLQKLYEYVQPVFKKYDIDFKHSPKNDEILEMMRKRAHDINELVTDSIFIFKRPLEYNDKAADKHFKNDAERILEKIAQAIQNIDDFTIDNIHNALTQLAQTQEIKMGKLAQPTRVALTGTDKSPGIYEVIYYVGKNETLTRLENAAKYIKMKK